MTLFNIFDLRNDLTYLRPSNITQAKVFDNLFDSVNCELELIMKVEFN